MNTRPFADRSLAAVLAAFLSLPLVASAADVLTWHNDAARTGLNAKETALTPGNVNATNFGKLFSIAVDGKVDAQPLYVTGLSIAGKGHNVVFIATEHDTVYACDADNGAVLWQVSMLKAGETTSDARGCNQVIPEIGITATPVIDRSAGPNGTIYIAAMSKDAAGNYFQRVHALNLTTGAEQFSGPRDVVATYPGTGDNSTGGNVVFDPKMYKERPGLVLANGLLYTSWSSHCDIRPYTGWVIAYNPTTLARVSVLNLTPNGTHGAIWASGTTPAVDPAGNLYALIADGTFDTTLDANRFPAQRDFGNCFVKLSTVNNVVTVSDYWTMFNTVAESSGDQDLGSGGAMVLPDLTDSNGQVRHLTVGAGKDTHIYLADRDNMGKFVPGATTNANLYQDLSGGLSGGVFSGPAYFNSRVYFGAVGDKIKAFHLTNARLDAVPAAQTTLSFGYPGATPSVSANGLTNGIVWAALNGSVAGLYAFDAGDLHQIYSSNDAANARDQFGVGNKFIVPTIANGKVFVGTTNSVAVFGLFNPPRLGNISTRANIGVDQNVLIGGFFIQGSDAKTVVLRGRGPSLGLPAALQDPVLELRGSDGARITSNDNWGDSPQKNQIIAAQLAPSDMRESAIYATLAPDRYTAVVSGAGGTGGLGIVELYDLSNPQRSTLGNLSARGPVGTVDNVLIGGVIVSGVAQQTVLFRAIGPDLAGAGVTSPLQDPVLEIRDANGAPLATNDNWQDSQSAQISATGLAPGDRRDSAVLITLSPANYTAIVKGAGTNVGVAVVEAFAVQ